MTHGRCAKAIVVAMIGLGFGFTLTDAAGQNQEKKKDKVPPVNPYARPVDPLTDPVDPLAVPVDPHADPVPRGCSPADGDWCSGGGGGGGGGNGSSECAIGVFEPPWVDPPPPQPDGPNPFDTGDLFPNDPLPPGIDPDDFVIHDPDWSDPSNWGGDNSTGTSPHNPEDDGPSGPWLNPPPPYPFDGDQSPFNSGNPFGNNRPALPPGLDPGDFVDYTTPLGPAPPLGGNSQGGSSTGSGGFGGPFPSGGNLGSNGPALPPGINPDDFVLFTTPDLGGGTFGGGNGGGSGALGGGNSGSNAGNPCGPSHGGGFTGSPPGNGFTGLQPPAPFSPPSAPDPDDYIFIFPVGPPPLPSDPSDPGVPPAPRLPPSEPPLPPGFDPDDFVIWDPPFSGQEPFDGDNGGGGSGGGGGSSGGGGGNGGRDGNGGGNDGGIDNPECIFPPPFTIGEVSIVQVVGQGPCVAWPLVPREELVIGSRYWITDPVVMDTGELIHGVQDLFWPHDGTSLAVHRTYRHKPNNLNADNTDFGRAWKSNLSITIDETANQRTAEVNLGAGELLSFTRPNTSQTTFTSMPGLEQFTLEKVGNTQYLLTQLNGFEYEFVASSASYPMGVEHTRNRYGEGETYEYDSNKHVTKFVVSDSPLKEIHIERNIHGNVTRIRDYASRTLDYEYDSNKLLTKVADGCDCSTGFATTEYDYDVADRLTEVKDALGNTLEIAYDGSGKAISQVYPNSGTQTYSYDNTLNDTRRTVTDREGNAYVYHFDNDMLLTKKEIAIADGDDVVYSYEFDDTVRLTRLTRPDNAVVEYQYNSTGNRVGIDIIANSTTHSQKFEYDTDPVELTLEIDELDRSMSYAYDASRSLTLLTRPDGSTRRFAYDSQGLQTLAVSGTGSTNTYTYDNLGFLDKVVNDSAGLQLTTDHQFDEVGNLESVQSPESRQRNRAFDGAGRVTFVGTVGGVTTQYTYDTVGRPVTRTISQSGGGDTFQSIWKYDAMGNIVTSITPDSSETHYEYDLNDRLITRTSPESRKFVVAYDELGRMLTAKFGTQGNLSIVSRFAYDAMSNIITMHDANANSTVYAYDDFSRLETRTDCDGDFTTYDYDAASQRTNLKRKSGTNTLFETVTKYDNVGQITETRILDAPGTESNDDSVVEWQFDDDDRLVTKTVHLDVSSSSSRLYEYDGASRLATLTNPTGDKVTYQYDKDGLLTFINRADLLNRTYAYDSNRRRTRAETSEGISRTYDYNAASRPVELILSDGVNSLTTDWVLDGVGNVLTMTAPDDSATQFEYDDDGHLTRRTTPESRVMDYTYDSHGRVVTAKDEGTITMRFDYDALGNIVTSADALGRETTYAYDCLNQLTLVADCDENSTQYTYSATQQPTEVRFLDDQGTTVAVRRIKHDKIGRMTESRWWADPAGGTDSIDDAVTELEYDRAGRVITTIVPIDATGGSTTVYRYDAGNRVVSQTDPEGQSSSYDYDAAGQLTSTTDAQGKLTTFGYDSDGRITSRTTPEGITIDIEYNMSAQPITRVVGDGGNESFTSRWVYDAVGNVVTAIAADNSEITYGYDFDRRLTQQTTPEARVMDFTYDSRGRLITLVDAGTTVLTQIYDDAGNVVTTRDANGNESTYEYDCRNMRTKSVDAKDNYTVTTYDAISRPTRVERFDAADAAILTDVLDYDALSRLIERRRLATAGGSDGPNDLVTEFVYDRAGRLLTGIDAVDASTSNTTTYSYDDRGLVLTVQNPDDRLTTYAYDAVGRRTKTTDAHGEDTTFAYDADGRLTLRTTPESIETHVSYDSLSRRTERIITDGGSTAFTTSWVYDAVSNVVTTVAPDSTETTFEYDLVRRLTRSTSPGGRVTDLTYDTRGRLLTLKIAGDTVEIQNYDDVGNRTSSRDAEGHETTYGYDSVNLLTKETDAVGNYTSYEHDAAHRVTLSARRRSNNSYVSSAIRKYDAIGRLVERRQQVNPGGTEDVLDAITEQIYDRAGRRITTLVTVDGSTKNTTTYIYNGVGRVLTVTDPESRVTSYAYDSLGQRTKTTNANNHATTFAYDADNRLTLQTTPEGIETKTGFDILGRRIQQIFSDGLSTTYTSSWVYDDVGNVVTATAPDGLKTHFEYDLDRQLTRRAEPSGRTTDLEYDARGRLVTRKVANTIIQRLAYDGIGNILSQTDAEGHQTSYEYDSVNRRTKEIDAKSDFTVYEFDAANRQTAVKRNEDSPSAVLRHRVMKYDGLGRMVEDRLLSNPGGAESVGDRVAKRVYDQAARLIALDEGEGKTTNYVYDGSGYLVTLTDADDFDTIYEYDGVGNRTKVVDANDHETQFEYDRDNRQTKITDALGHYTEIAYDIRGLQTDVSNYASGAAHLVQTTYAYDDAGRQTIMRRHSDPGGGSKISDTVTKTFYDGGGRVTKTTGASGFDTTYAYDAFDRRTRMTLSDGSYDETEYDLNGRVTKQIQYELVDAGTHSFTYVSEVDSLGRVTKAVNQGPDGNFGATMDNLDVEYIYDAAGRQISLIDEAGRITVTEYDAFDQQIKVTEDSGGIGRVTNFVYDLAGRLGEIIAENDNTGDQTTRYTYNGRDLQTMITYEETGDVTMTYDAVGNLVTRVDEENVTVVYNYDDVDRLIERKDSAVDADVETYAYDGLGRLVTAEKGTSANPDAVSRSVFTFDNLSQLEQESQAIAESTAKVVSYDYDVGGNRIEMIHHGNAATVTYAYDNRDRCTQIDNDTVRLADYTWLGNAVHRRDTTCDYYGNTKPKFRSDYQRDGILRVTRLAHDHQTLNMADSGYSSLGTFDYTYDAASNLLTADQTASIGDLDVDRDYRYDTLDRLTHVDPYELQAFNIFWQPVYSTYEYDDLGNRKTHVYRGGVHLLQQPTLVYEHDKANRMSKITGQGSYSGVSNPDYDKAGNQTFAYSADRGTSYTYSYDHQNRLLAVHDDTGTTRKAAFTYDALGRRIEFINDVTADTVRYYYDGTNEIVETNASGNELRHYVHGISYVDERLMMMRHDLADADDDRPYYYVLDRQYSVWMVVDRAGAIVERYAYDPYGRPLIRQSAGRGDMNNDTDINGTDNTRFMNELNGTIWDPRADMNDSGSVTNADGPAFANARVNVWTEAAPTVSQAFSDADNPFMFQGRVHFAIDTAASDTSGKLMLNDHRLRFSDAVTGRWLTRDPLGYVDGFNLYEYVGSNPVIYADPQGTEIWVTSRQHEVVGTDGNRYAVINYWSHKNGLDIGWFTGVFMPYVEESRHLGYELLLINESDPRTRDRVADMRADGERLYTELITLGEDIERLENGALVTGVAAGLTTAGALTPIVAPTVSGLAATEAGLISGAILGGTSGGVACGTTEFILSEGDPTETAKASLEGTAIGSTVGAATGGLFGELSAFLRLRGPAAIGTGLGDDIIRFTTGTSDDIARLTTGVADDVVRTGAKQGAVTNANWAQPKFSPSRAFSEDGRQYYTNLAGRPINTIDDLAAAIKDGTLSIGQVPVDYVVVNGQRVILNTRTSDALNQAGIPRSRWYGVDQTGKNVPKLPGKTFDDLALDQTTNNKLPPTGTPKPPWEN